MKSPYMKRMDQLKTILIAFHLFDRIELSWSFSRTIPPHGHDTKWMPPLRPQSLFSVSSTRWISVRSISSSFCLDIPTRIRKETQIGSVSSTTTRLHGVDLSTNLEWLANDRTNEYEENSSKDPPYQIEWFDPYPIVLNKDDEEDSEYYDEEDNEDDVEKEGPYYRLYNHDSKSVTKKDVKKDNIDIMEDMLSNSMQINDNNKTNKTYNKDEKQYRMPLYPLNACYLPSKSSQTLNNVRARNVRMAEDLEKGMYNGLFCTTLQAKDSGRMAKIGTIMKLQSIDKQFNYDGSIQRIVVTCTPLQRVEILHVENPSCWSPQNQIRNTDEYLMSKVQTISDHDHYEFEDGIQANEKYVNEIQQQIQDEQKIIVEQICQDFAMVRYTYKSQDVTAVGSLPPFAIKAMQEIPPLTQTSFFGRSSSSYFFPHHFWKCVELWQSVCYTIREAKCIMIQSDMNEVMIEAAMKQGGPLNLPIHKEDLTMEVQIQIDRMEQNARMEFMDSGMDPCLDFQNLLSCRDYMKRLKLFRRMVSRERQRLEAKQRLDRNEQLDEDNDDIFSSDNGIFQ